MRQFEFAAPLTAVPPTLLYRHDEKTKTPPRPQPVGSGSSEDDDGGRREAEKEGYRGTEISSGAPRRWEVYLGCGITSSSS